MFRAGVPVVGIAIVELHLVSCPSTVLRTLLAQVNLVTSTWARLDNGRYLDLATFLRGRGGYAHLTILTLDLQACFYGPAQSLVGGEAQGVHHGAV